MCILDSLSDIQIHVLCLFFPSLGLTCSLNGAFSWAGLPNFDEVHFMVIAFGVLLKKSLLTLRS